MRCVIVSALMLISPIGGAQTFSSLPGDFREALVLVPSDSESLVATLKPFQLRKRSVDIRNPSPFIEELQWLAITANLRSGKELLELYAPLEGREVLWALASKRGQEVRTRSGSRIIELGVHPYESVTIAKFRDPLPAEFMTALGTTAKSKSLIENVEIFELDKSRFALVYKRDLLITVTTLTSNESMLSDVVRRLTTTGDRLFESAVVVWPLVKFESTFWGIRKTRSGGGRGDDAKNRDWVLFSYDSGKPYSATFQSVLRGDGNPKEMLSHQYGVSHGETIRKDMGAKLSVEANAGLLQTTVECLPDHRDRCLGLFFIYEAYGVMIWI